MAKNILVISCDIAETRVALIENGIIAELHIERRGQPLGGTVGDIYLGKVTRVLPGLQAAFIDIGHERAAFLHVEDLIRPDDFESYLAGGRKHAVDEERPAPVEEDLDEEEPAAAASAQQRDSHVNPAVPDAPSMSDLQAEAEEALESGAADRDSDADAEGLRAVDEADTTVDGSIVGVDGIAANGALVDSALAGGGGEAEALASEDG